MNRQNNFCGVKGVLEKHVDAYGNDTPFEPLYELVKTDKNQVWFLYEKKLNKLILWLSYWKSFPKDELLQQSYIYFHTLCEQYDPLYNGNFFPFDRYLFKNLITKLRAYIQRYYFKNRREKPSDCDFLLENHSIDTIKDSDSKLYVEYIYSLLTGRQREVVEMTLSGYKQAEIGRKLNISQSRVSVIKKRALHDLYMIIDESHTDEEKKEMKVDELKQIIYNQIIKK